MCHTPHMYSGAVLLLLLLLLLLLFYASSAWWGFSTTADRQRLCAFLRRGVRAGLYGADDPGVTQIVDDADNNFSETFYQTTSYSIPLIAQTDHSQTPT